MKGKELKLTEVNMTALTISGLILLFMIVPYLTGNVYGFVFRKKEMGIYASVGERKRNIFLPFRRYDMGRIK